MKKFSHLFLLIAGWSVLFTTSLGAYNVGDETTSFKVNGACTMCKKKIETSLRVKGVKKVNWDRETHLLTVTYNPTHITLEEMHHRIAAIGYDTDKVKASDEAYNKLDECCQYKREE